MLETTGQVLQGLAYLGLGIGAIVGFAYWFFKKLGASWLETKFAEQLEAYKHKQQKELEHLRLQINTLFDRTTKLHQREFEVLPEAWAKLTDAYWKTLGFISPIKEYPDLSRMSDEYFIEFVDTSQLLQSEKEELKRQDGQDRNTFYTRHIYWARLMDTRTPVTEAHIYILKNGIFLPAEIKTKFIALSDLLWEAVMENQFYKQHEDIRPQKRDKQDAVRERGEGLLKDLESVVSRRLRESIEPLNKGPLDN